MRRLSVVLALATLAGGAPALLADSIPYANVGTPAPSSTLVAQSTGSVTGYFLGQSAADNSVVRMIDVTSGYTSVYLFPNHSTAVGASADFGPVNAGDILIFELLDLSSGFTLSTDAATNIDGVNHGYATLFAGGLLGTETYPAGTYIGMEDTPWGDYDYNDNQFLFTNVAPAPEPGTLLLLGTGILGAAGTLRRKMFAR
ncbi:MAG: PEP-CTERM sorting domain-containing protein [Acidobacteria bacterium]|nr:PEP-CTERM sorting domain-containing protein [Acidobacteriota bacterium]